ncbi:DUF3306 domain-containing protein [Vibrio fluminensis]|uniref:DUF3306 domain-containing protein n=1 Tax=Vibrio fluminensis TaxID=2783614 RepID=UPI001E489AAA|nr:DUF3306 domain-containing protein [Vibrio fluminensis]
MVTSFISRWSKRKLDEKTKELLATEQTQVVDEKLEDSVNSDEALQETSQLSSSSEEALETTEATQSEAVESEQPQEMSIANLLASEAEQSVKKAALRKLFLSEEFNVRDGLDDYDEDYSNLKTLSQSVAETLRDWVKDKSEEQPENAEPVAAASSPQESDTENTKDEAEAEAVESDEIALESEGNEADQNVSAEMSDSEGDETKYTTQ